MTEEKKKAAGRPPKAVREAIKKHEAPKIEMTPPPAGPEEKKKIAILDEKTQIFRIYQGMVAGKSIQEVAEELKIQPSTVRQHIVSAVDHLNSEIAQIKTSWAQIWLARTERMVKRMMERLENGGIMDKDFIDSMDKIQKMQERILGVGSGAPQGAGVQVNLIQTVDHGSDLYNQAT